MLTIIFKLISFVQRKYEQRRKYILKTRFATCGNNVDIHLSCNILAPAYLSIGNNSSVGAYTTIFAGFGVSIGKNCLISTNCGISSVNHIQEAYIRYEGDSAEATGSKPVIIGDNVWLGMNTCVLPGITIGDNSIVGAGSVVTKNIPSNEIWVGNPARFVKKLDMPAQQ
ncbi:DapH/DapD/GlmU-related protein [Hymenobacter sp. UV11]|uniref:acyltransferase n=1 Tax=Hymenobacter sp. UV11 TaxID=1849735 RepID=UPI0014150636|nr:acyltransferase [Hymenobacter sp. UV11]